MWYTINQINLTYQVKKDPSPIHRQPQRLVTWTSPDGDIIKLNVDGSSLGNLNISGFRGILSNSCGEWLLGFGGNCSFTTNMHAELVNIYKGLRRAWETGFKYVICETDSLMAHDFLLKIILLGITMQPSLTRLKLLLVITYQ